MFTGIVEKSVSVIGVAKGPKFDRLTLAVSWPDLRDGESVAVNGVCLTVADRSEGEVGFDVVQETLSRTNLGLLKAGDKVHVERSLRFGDRLDGHLVQGHVDGTARLSSRVSDDHEWRLTLKPQHGLMQYIVPKGSVTLDGVSLTVARAGRDDFDVVLIPTTVRLTSLADRDEGWVFNLETDMISRTVVGWLERQRAVSDDRGTE